MDSRTTSSGAVPAPAAVSVPHVATSTRCPNCDAPRLGPYCQGCGQHHVSEPLEIRTLARDFLERQFSLEGGLVRTVIELTVRPGAMIRDYLEGKRQRYMNPVAYMLLSATVYVLLLPLWIDGFLTDTTRDLEGVGEETARAMELSMTLLSHPMVVTFFSLVVFIPALRVLFRPRITAAEATVFSLYTFAHASILGSVAIPLILLVADWPVGVVSGTSLIPWFGVLGYAAGGYFGWKFGTFTRTAAAMVLSSLGTFALAVAVLLVYLIGGMLVSGG